jgi:hypothetical protein
MPTLGPDLNRVPWRESSYSNPDGGDCVEVADGLPGVVPVRGSKSPHGPALVFGASSWAASVVVMSASSYGR